MNKIIGIAIAALAIISFIAFRYYVPNSTIDNAVETVLEESVKAETGIDIDPILKNI